MNPKIKQICQIGKKKQFPQVDRRRDRESAPALRKKFQPLFYQVDV